MQIAIISDTHMPRGDRRLPDACVERLRAADLIIHAGDLMRLPVLEQLNRLGRVVAVHGNVDDAAVRAVLPAAAVVDCAGARLGVIHDAGPAKGRLARLRARFPDADAAIFGHSHIPVLEHVAGFQIFNPGSPTERRRAPRPSMGLLGLRAGRLELEHVWL
jgi:uncharacterized protein